MNMKNILYFLVSGFIILSSYSCDDFLDKSPTKSMGIRITHVDELEALLNKNNFSSGAILDNNSASVLCGDAFEMNTDYYDAGINDMTNTPEVYQLMFWEMGYTKNTNENISMWKDNYEVIYLANLVLLSLDKVEGDEQKKKIVSYRAHLLRAYNYLELACYYCMPYGAKTLNEMGLPIKKSTSYDESMVRVSLKETYEFIKKDLDEAVKLEVPLFQNGVRKTWQETGATANAIAARYYMIVGDYEKAGEHAKKALEFGNDLADLNDEKEIKMIKIMSIADMSMVSVSNWLKPEVSKKTFMCDKSRAYYNRTNYYLTMKMWGIPSAKLLEAYNHDFDLRYRYFISKEFQKIFFMGVFGRNFKMNVPGYGTFDGKYSTASDVAEMRLAYAECLARTGKVAEAMAELNSFRKFRIDKNAPANVINLAASNKNEAIALILKERMMEFPFTQRWNDIRRCNFNDDPSDDVVIKRRFYQVNEFAIDKGNIKEYVLDSSSRNYAVALPNAEIVAGNGAIEQNKY